MKSGDAMLLHLAATVPEPTRDLTFVFYDCEEIEHDRNGLTRIAAASCPTGWPPTWRSSASRPTGRSRPAARAPLRSSSTVRGRRAHSARSWLGDNAIHAAGAGAGPARRRTEPRIVDIDGCVYREGLNAVAHHAAGWPATSSPTSA